MLWMASDGRGKERSLADVVIRAKVNVFLGNLRL